MTAREEYQAVEAQLANIEQQLTALRWYDEEWGDYEAGRRMHAPMHPGGDRQFLTLERERLQTESFRLWQRMRAEAPGV